MNARGAARRVLSVGISLLVALLGGTTVVPATQVYLVTSDIITLLVTVLGFIVVVIAMAVIQFPTMAFGYFKSTGYFKANRGYRSLNPAALR
jgi:hypothetical protein